MQKMFLPLLLLFSSMIFAQEELPKQTGQFWFHAGIETAMYGQQDGFTFGGALEAGYSIRGGAFGLKTAWFTGIDGENILELNLLVRFWLGSDLFSGFFYQFQAGAAFFAPSAALLFGKDNDFTPTVSFAAFGYRFPLGDRYFIEPVLRFGYPYLAGLSVSAGMFF